jgi:hypothetical protein
LSPVIALIRKPNHEPKNNPDSNHSFATIRTGPGTGYPAGQNSRKAAPESSCAALGQEEIWINKTTLNEAAYSADVFFPLN